MSDFERFKAAFEQGAELPTPAKGDNGPRFAAVTAAVEHVAGLVETPSPKARAKKAARAKGRSVAPAAPLRLDPVTVARFVASGIERDRMRAKKEAGLSPPYSDDPVMAAAYLCNVHHKDDRGSRWKRANIIEPCRNDPDLAIKVAIAVFINEQAALAEIDWTAPLDLARYRTVLEAREARGEKIFRTDAYKPPMPGKGEGTLQHLFEVVLPPIWREREDLRPRDGDTLQAFCDRWRGCYKIGDFLAGQITAHMKHVAPLINAADRHAFAVPGPGSKRGLNRLCGRPLKAGWSEAQWHATLLYLQAETEAAFAAAGLDPLSAQDIQHWLCEFDKIERARENGGVPSRKYHAAIGAPKKQGQSGNPRDPPATASQPPAPHCLAAALAYAARGWKLFPAPRGSKKSHRKARDGGERWGATRDSEEIRQDFARWPEANIGLPTDRDNGFWVLDADTKQGGHKHDGVAALGALMVKHGLLPETRMAMSPSGSWHYYFKHPPGLTISSRADCPAPGIDVKGDGGMVLAPPSVWGDGAYRWISEAEIAEAPRWLLDLVATPKDDKPRTAAADAELLGALCDIEAAVAAIANNDLDWESWNRFGMAIFAASGGSEEGFAAFDRFSAKSGKYDSDTTREKWQAFNGCPPDRIGFDFLASEAHKADPEWRFKAARANTTKAEASPEGQRAQETPPELVSVYASEIEMEALEWLWPGRFARGKLGIIAGLPDEGKGLLRAKGCSPPTWRRV
jgi:hypothetical protein